MCVCVCVCVSCSVMSDFVTPWGVAHQAPLPMGFSRQEYWSGLPFIKMINGSRNPVFMACSPPGCIVKGGAWEDPESRTFSSNLHFKTELPLEHGESKMLSSQLLVPGDDHPVSLF